MKFIKIYTNTTQQEVNDIIWTATFNRISWCYIEDERTWKLRWFEFQEEDDEVTTLLRGMCYDKFVILNQGYVTKAIQVLVRNA
jgi:hypothetical protein